MIASAKDPTVTREPGAQPGDGVTGATGYGPPSSLTDMITLVQDMVRQGNKPPQELLAAIQSAMATAVTPVIVQANFPPTKGRR